MELSDLEIFKRIAKIEKLNQVEIKGDVFVSHGFSCDKRYNPLTDYALWAKLIMKHEVSISFNFCLVSMITDKQYEMNFTDIPSLKRKALLLIIDAHKESV